MGDIVGLILNKKCKPVANARVEIWHAGGEHDGMKGIYTFGNDSNGYNWRGYVKSDDNGYYRFKTIYPANYKDRPITHVHTLIRTGEIGDTKGKELVTQLYFRDDIPPGFTSSVRVPWWNNGELEEFLVKDRETQFAQKITTYEGEQTIETGKDGKKESRKFKHKTAHWNIVLDE